MSTEQPLPILDDLGQAQAIDRRNMLRLINELPEQCETALGIGRSFRCEPLAELPNVIFITGAGDSAIAADMAAAILGEETDVPIISDHGGRVPRCVGEKALVLVLDYTGKSEATLRNYKESRMRGARVVCLGSGGKLLETVSKDGSEVLKIPPGQPPRSAVGYLLVPIVALFEACGLAVGASEKLTYGIRLLKNIRESFRFENTSARNIAKQTAEALTGKLAVIYGAPGYRAVVANRWKNQINANSKSAAFAGVFPEAATSDISTWAAAGEQAQNAALVFLKDSDDKTEVGALMNASKAMLPDLGIVEIEIRGGTTVEKLFYGSYMGDYVSYYMAMLKGVDPSAEPVAPQSEVPSAEEKPEDRSD